MGRQRGHDALLRRRPKLESTVEEEDSSEDPIAAALAAREKRRLAEAAARLRAAAAAAAAAFGNDKTTVLRESSGASSSADASVDQDPDPAAPVLPENADRDGVVVEKPESNPKLLSLLGEYSDDDSDGDSENSQEPGKEPSTPTQAPPANKGAQKQAQEAPTESSKAKDQVDDQLMSFMSDLEDSGLLAEAEEEATPDEAAEVANTKPEEHVSGTLISDVETALPVGWQEVFDTASQSVYYWNVSSGEVSWDRPQEPQESQPASLDNAPPSSDDHIGGEATRNQDGANIRDSDVRPMGTEDKGLEAGEEPFSGKNRNIANSSDNCSSIVPDPSTPSLGGTGNAEAARNGAAEGGPSGGGLTSLSAELQAFGSLLVAKLQAIVGGGLDTLPKAMQLLIEAQLRIVDLHMMDMVDPSLNAGYEQYASNQLQRIEAEMPQALLDFQAAPHPQATPLRRAQSTDGSAPAASAAALVDCKGASESGPTAEEGLEPSLPKPVSSPEKEGASGAPLSSGPVATPKESEEIEEGEIDAPEPADDDQSVDMDVEQDTHPLPETPISNAVAATYPVGVPSFAAPAPLVPIVPAPYNSMYYAPTVVVPPTTTHFFNAYETNGAPQPPLPPHGECEDSAVPCLPADDDFPDNPTPPPSPPESDTEPPLPPDDDNLAGIACGGGVANGVLGLGSLTAENLAMHTEAAQALEESAEATAEADSEWAKVERRGQRKAERERRRLEKEKEKERRALERKEERRAEKRKRVAAGVSAVAKKMPTGLLAKWQKVKQEAVQTQGSDSDEDPEARMRIKKLREIEEWKAEHVESGEAADNSNFAPIQGDWRERLKMAQEQRREIGDTVPSSSQPVAADGAGDLTNITQTLDLTPYNLGLPEGWQAFYDHSSSGVYYGNLITQATSWERPTQI